MPLTHLGLRSCIFLLSAIAVAVPVTAQQQPIDMNLDRGIKPSKTYDRARESVGIESGNLNISIPLVQLPGRDGHGLDVSLTYNSQNWTPVASLANGSNDSSSIYIGWGYANNGTIGLGSTGWQINIPTLYMSGVTTFSSGSSGPPPYGQSYSATMCWSNFVLVMGDGSKYSFPNANLGCQQQQTECGSAGTSCLTHTVPWTYYPEQLVDYDGGSYPSYVGADGEGQGVMLDMTQVNQGLIVVRFRDGSKILFQTGTGWQATPTGSMSMTASALVDSNGNVISISDPGGNATFTDTLGRQVVVNPGSGVQYKDSSGTTRTITFNYASFLNNGYPVATPTFAAPAAGSDGIVSVSSDALEEMLSSIVLPNGLSYTFQYNQYGEILEITYPSGGYTRYTYQAFPVNGYEWTTAELGDADNREVVEKDTCSAVAVAAGATSPSGYVGSSVADTCPMPEQRTTYVRQPAPNNTVNVTDPMGNLTIYTFGGCDPASASTVPGGDPSEPEPGLVNYGYGDSPLELSRAVYQGSSTLLRTVNTTYSGCLPTSRTTILSNGLESKIGYTYDENLSSYTMNATDRGVPVTEQMYAETDNLLSEQDYGFGQGSPGTLLKAIDYEYLDASTYQHYPVYILNRRTSESVYDGNGDLMSQTLYEYDNYEGGIVPSYAVQHGTALNSYGTGYTTRGNVTAVTRWLNTSSPELTTRNYEFDDAGNVLVQKDPLGHTTTFSYSDSWGNAACSPDSTDGPAATYPTSITNALGQKTSYTWNSCTGTLASTTDPNGQPTTFDYDLMDRRVAANYPDGGQTCLQYSDAQNSFCPSESGGVLPIQIATTRRISQQGQNETSVEVLDGLSRVIQTQLTSDPGGTDYVNTTYNVMGEVASVTNPYRSTSDSTYGITSYQYDALGRKTIQTEPDGSTEYWCYDGVADAGQPNCSAHIGSVGGLWVDFTDGNGNHWQRTSDALGRLTSVIEDASGAKLETDYQYDALNDLTRVDQWGGASGSAGDRVRTFSYDSLGRLIASTNPESGTISYNYDANGNVISKTSPAPNSTSGTITTAYTYDPLNRVLSKITSDAAGTPADCYQYDTSALAGTGANLIGRLTNEWTQSATANNGACAASMPTSGTLITSKSILSYDPMGRVLTEQTCVFPAACSTSTNEYPLAFTYDLAGDLTSYTNGNNSALFTDSYDRAGRLNSVTTSWTDATHPSPLFSNPAYDPAGQLTGALYGPSLTLGRTYDNRLLVTGETAQGGTGQSQ